MASPTQRAPKPVRGGPVRAGPAARLGIVLVGCGLWLSGGLWLIFHYFMRRPGEWGPEPHELEPWWLRLHGAFAFMALWTIGLLWGVHVVRGWNTGRNRWTGGLLLGWLLLQICTAWLLLYATDQGPLELVSPIHWIAGLCLPLAYLLHRFARKRT